MRHRHRGGIGIRPQHDAEALKRAIFILLQPGEPGESVPGRTLRPLPRHVIAVQQGRSRI